MKEFVISLVVILIAGVVAGAVAGYVFLNQDVVPLGSVSQTSGYDYIQKSGAIATSSLIYGGPCILGSVIINEDQAGVVTLWDATSTAAVTKGLYPVKVAIFQTASAEGVYTFDTNLKYGLVMVSADGFAFAGDWTITYRPGN